MASAQTLMSVDTSASEHGHPTSIDGRHEAKVIYDGGVGCCSAFAPRLPCAANFAARAAKDGWRG
jgi:hypothetical protein|eukprot:COSAG01_NODE_6412_length_3678_cov_4.864767_7_plen_65_part_00